MKAVSVAPLEPGAVGADLPGAEVWVEYALLAVAVALGLGLVWFGPLSTMTRVGARWALATLAPPRAGAITLVLLMLVASAVLVVLALSGQSVFWWPLPEPPDLA